MSKRKTKLTPKKYIQIGLILLAFVGVSFLTLNIINDNIEAPKEDKTTDDYREKTEDGNKEEQKTEKKEEHKEEEKKEEQEQEKNHQNYEGENPNRKDELTGIITTARTSGDNFIVRISIDQFLSSGSCELILENNEKKYTEQVDIISDASSSTCEGFDIPVYKLENGTWNLTVNLSSGEKTGKIKEEVTVE